jgi:GT2 family glycosyltransferase
MVSIIIPAYNSFDRIELCLEALRRQTTLDFEVIVVNSSPEDRTRKLIEDRFPEVLFRQSDQRLLPHGARNLGVELASGRTLIFSDPDCVPHPDWLERLLAAQKGDQRVVQGSMGLLGSRWLERGVHLCKWHALLPGLPPRPLGLIATGNALYPRAVWEAIGPFDGDLWAGDAVLSWRAAERGFELWFEPQAVIDQIHDDTFRSHCRERWIRGQEFGSVRATREGWSRAKCALVAACLPGLAIVVLGRTALDSLRAGWLRSFLTTFPVHCSGNLAWLVGEAQAQIRRAFGLRKDVAVQKEHG